MRLLLDSHVVVWWLSSPRRLNSEVRSAIADVTNEIYVSSASLWELQIKAAKGKIQMPLSLAKVLKDQEFLPLGVNWEHAEYVRQLPAIHADPFDRMLVAQSLCEGLTLVTGDRYILEYNVPVMKVN